MVFYAQALLSDVPELGPDDDTLLSFHWCSECAWEGASDFGASSREFNAEQHGSEFYGYQVTLFGKPGSITPDGLGVVSVREVEARGVTFETTRLTQPGLSAA
jgi:hypothetical protein